MIHPLPKYQALELEQEWKQEQKAIYQSNQRQESVAERACEGKEYFKISKTKNLNNCKVNPFYQNFVGLQSKCDGSQSGCPDLFNVIYFTLLIIFYYNPYLAKRGGSLEILYRDGEWRHVSVRDLISLLIPVKLEGWHFF